MRLKESGQFIDPEGAYAVTWRDVNDAPHVDVPEPRQGQLFLGKAKVDVRNGTVTGCMFGTLTLCSGDRTYAGPYDGWALYLDGCRAVRWRAKTLHTASADGLVFDDGSRVDFGPHSIEIPKPLGPGLVRLECVSVRNRGRRYRRALSVPDARLSPDGKLITWQRPAGGWPPAPGYAFVRTPWGRGYVV